MAEGPLFAQLLLMGLLIAAPVGPIGLLTIQRSLQFGTAAGLATGLGAAVADALYGAVGAFGVVWLISALTALRLPLALAGGAYLVWMAIELLRLPQPAGAPATATAPTGGWGYFGGTFLLTLVNPATIFSFIAIFGSMAGANPVASPWTMVFGVFAGSALWWLFLSTLVGWLRGRFDARWRRRVSLVSAMLLSGFAAWQLVLALTLPVGP